MSFVAALLGLILAVGAYFFYSDSTILHNSPTTETPNETPRETRSSRAVNRSGENLTTLPREILSMTDLTELNLANNRLTGALPAEIRQLANLEVLILSQNEMTGVPAEIGQLTKLRVLNLADNQLTGLPHEIGNLQNLETLDLSGNRVSESDLEIIRSRLPSSTQILR